MTNTPPNKPKQGQKAPGRKDNDKLKDALRANLKRRKKAKKPQTTGT